MRADARETGDNEDECSEKPSDMDDDLIYDFDDNESAYSDGPSSLGEIDELVNSTCNDDTPRLPYQCVGSVTRWNFPAHISQSTIDGRNGSTACSVISLVVARNLQNITLSSDPSFASQAWYQMMTRAIRIGNYIYDIYRDTLPRRYLTVAEAVDVVEPYAELSITSAYPARVCDKHKPSTLRYQLLWLLNSSDYDSAIFIIDEKAVVFASLGQDKLVFFDSHVHGRDGAVVISGTRECITEFIAECQKAMGFSSNTFGNIVFVKSSDLEETA